MLFSSLFNLIIEKCVLSEKENRKRLFQLRLFSEVSHEFNVFCRKLYFEKLGGEWFHSLAIFECHVKICPLFGSPNVWSTWDITTAVKEDIQKATVAFNSYKREQWLQAYINGGEYKTFRPLCRHSCDLLSTTSAYGRFVMKEGEKGDKENLKNLQEIFVQCVDELLRPYLENRKERLNITVDCELYTRRIILEDIIEKDLCDDLLKLGAGENMKEEEVSKRTEKSKWINFLNKNSRVYQLFVSEVEKEEKKLQKKFLEKLNRLFPNLPVELGKAWVPRLCQHQKYFCLEEDKEFSECILRWFIFQEKAVNKHPIFKKYIQAKNQYAKTISRISSQTQKLFPEEFIVDVAFNKMTVADIRENLVSEFLCNQRAREMITARTTDENGKFRFYFDSDSISKINTLADRLCRAVERIPNRLREHQQARRAHLEKIFRSDHPRILDCEYLYQNHCMLYMSLLTNIPPDKEQVLRTEIQKEISLRLPRLPLILKLFKWFRRTKKQRKVRYPLYDEVVKFLHSDLGREVPFFDRIVREVLHETLEEKKKTQIRTLLWFGSSPYVRNHVIPWMKTFEPLVQNYKESLENIERDAVNWFKEYLRSPFEGMREFKMKNMHQRCAHLSNLCRTHGVRPSPHVIRNNASKSHLYCPGYSVAVCRLRERYPNCSLNTKQFLMLRLDLFYAFKTLEKTKRALGVQESIQLWLQAIDFLLQEEEEIGGEEEEGQDRYAICSRPSSIIS